MKLYLEHEFFSENCGEWMFSKHYLIIYLQDSHFPASRYPNLPGSHLKEGTEIFAP